MSAEIDRAVDILRKEPLADLAELLSPEGRREVLEALAGLGARGRPARVLVTPSGAPLGGYRVVWDRLALDPQKDLLLLYNGRRWEARGFGHAAAEIQRRLATAEPALRRGHADGLREALTALAHDERQREPARPAPPSSGSGLGTIAIGGGAVVAVGLVGLVIARRRKLARERATGLAEARSSADQVFADVMIAAEELPDGDELRTRAARLKGELDALPKALPAHEEPMMLARLGQLENELEALRSVVLQKKRRP